MTNPYHQANRQRWELGAASLARGADARGLWNQCHKNPALVLDAAELKWLDHVAGKQVAVLGSGDNQTVFALAGMGAHVTSVDISENQLAVARARAVKLGLKIDFLHADVTDLSALASDQFDLVYTGGHVAVWVSDLPRYYREAGRILKPGARFMVSEYHPFRRLWKDLPDRLEIACSYFDRGPYRYLAAENVLSLEPGPIETFEFHWTLADYVAAVLGAGCQIDCVEEFGTSAAAWEGAPMTGLPEALLIVATKQPRG